MDAGFVSENCGSHGEGREKAGMVDGIGVTKSSASCISSNSCLHSQAQAHCHREARALLGLCITDQLSAPALPQRAIPSSGGYSARWPLPFLPGSVE